MSAVLKFLAAARSLANQGLSKEAIQQFAKNEFGEISELLQRQIDNIYKPGKGIPSIKKDPDFDDTVIQMQIDEFGPFNPKDPLKNLKKQTEGLPSIKKGNKRQLTDDEIEELDMDVGGLEYFDFDGTVESANKIRKQRADYIADMELEYKKGNLDPVAGDKSSARKRFLEKKLEEMEASGDKRLMTPDEIEELSTFDLQTDMDKAVEKFKKKDAKQKKILKDFDPEDRDPNAQGGRAGFKDGMSRRKFMQIMGGLAALPIVGKFFKLGKVATKAAPIVKTPPVPGKPEWFDSLVNKVILEGDDVTKQFATKEREIVHRVNLEGTADKTKKFETYDDSVYVYRDLDDGTVRVEYNSLDNMSEAPVNLTFKPGMADEATKGKPADTFQADEIVPESRMVGPDDFEIEDAVDEFDNVIDLNSDVSKLKQFAGEKLTTKEIVEGINKRKRSRAIVEDRSEAADFMTSRQGDYDPSPDDFASGGIARMLGE